MGSALPTFAELRPLLHTRNLAVSAMDEDSQEVRYVRSYLRCSRVSQPVQSITHHAQLFDDATGFGLRQSSGLYHELGRPVVAGKSLAQSPPRSNRGASTL